MIPAAYYNEIDSFAAQWLRNLIAGGHIAPGEVDERSIEDVTPDDLRGFTQCHFFAGIGVWSHSLRLAGWPDDKPVWTGSCPCQPFSAAGKGDGFADERHLWPHFFHLISERRPQHVFGEQVAAGNANAWFDLWIMQRINRPLEVNGFWRDADWLFCRDGKWRPVEPGTFPLVDGAAARLGRVEPGVARVASSNRVGRLKGYGNAINAQAAAEFIRAYMGVSYGR
ncbi:DNA cytosine methyltransferase [Salmonella enterica]|nr:DNA cytosine methyltransferase [Salmonella enterica]